MFHMPSGLATGTLIFRDSLRSLFMQGQFDELHVRAQETDSYTCRSWHCPACRTGSCCLQGDLELTALGLSRWDLGAGQWLQPPNQPWAPQAGENAEVTSGTSPGASWQKERDQPHQTC